MEPQSQPPDREQILEALSSITTSLAFQKSDRMSTLLRYLVTESLDKPGQTITAEAIAAAVFKRGDDFVNVDDPIVRTTVSRLRAALASHYGSTDCAEKIEILIPKGTYCPQYNVIAAQAKSKAPRFDPIAFKSAIKPMHFALCVLIAVPLMAMLIAFLPREPPWKPSYPTIFVQPTRTLSELPEVKRVGTELDALLLSKLSTVGGAEIVDGSETLAAKGPQANIHDARYELQATIWQEGESVSASWRLMDLDTSIVVWASKDPIQSAPTERANTLASKIAAEVLGTDGAVPILRTRIPGADKLSVCLAKSRRYIFTIVEDNQQEIASCLEKAVAASPDFADGWAMLSYCYHRLAIYAVSRGEDPALYKEKAKTAARHAEDLAPDGFLTQEALAHVAFDTGDLDAFRTIVYKLLKRYPGDPDLKVRAGIKLATLGDQAYGTQLLTEGFEDGRATNKVGYLAFGVLDYMKGNYAAALENLMKAKGDSDYLCAVILAATYGQLGEKAKARAMLDEVLASRPAYAKLFRQDAENRRASKPIIDRLIDGLRKAGLNVE